MTGNNKLINIIKKNSIKNSGKIDFRFEKQ